MQWNEQIEINAPIKNVWNLFTEENMQRIMPQIVSIKKIYADSQENTTVYEQTYREGKRDETYMYTEKIVTDTHDEKIKEFFFTIANTIRTDGVYFFRAISDNKTLFTYEGKNTGVSFFGKLMLKMAGKTNNLSVVTDFCKLVKKESEK